MNRHVKSILLGISIAFFSLLPIGEWGYFTFLHHYEGMPIDIPFDRNKPLDVASIPTLKKEKGKDFVILNLADLQLCDLEDTCTKQILHQEVDELVNRVSPDLITLTGDQTWSNENLLSLEAIISWMESYKVMWAPIFGNHDHGNDFSTAVAGLSYCCDLYENAPHCLFSRGPTDIGSLGNYCVNIQEKETIIKTLYLFDLGYLDGFSPLQHEYFSYLADGIASSLGYVPEGMLFTHKDLREYRTAYNHYLEGKAESEGKPYVYYAYSWIDETGFGELAKSKGVKDFFCAHQHGNSFSIKDDGARYTFCLKTGEFGGYIENDEVYLNGATVISIGEEGTDIRREFVDRGKYKIPR